MAGIADPRWPLGNVRLTADSRGVDYDGGKRVLSPFDEAALEIALKIRDARPESQVRAVLAQGRDTDALLRQIAGHRLDAVFSVELAPAWDGVSSAQALRMALGSTGEAADLILIGREFGDCDDGALAPALAEVSGRHFSSLVQDVAWNEGGLELVREDANATQWLPVTVPALASVTNDRRNRLRHPLMKNVMAAKRAVFETLPRGEGAIESFVTLTSATAVPAPKRAAACRILTGSVDDQAVEFRDWLRHWNEAQ